MTGHQPPAWVERYIHKAYRNGGSGPDAYDCFRLAACASNENLGTAIPLCENIVPDQGRGNVVFREDCQRLLDLWKEGGWRQIESPRIGDFIRLRRGRHLQHCGLVVATLPRPAWRPPAGVMLHVHKGINVTCEEWHGPRWVNRVSGFFRWTGTNGPSPGGFGPQGGENVNA